MSNILILSGNQAIVEKVKRAISSGDHVITAMPPEAGTLAYFTTASVDLVFIGDRSDSVTPDYPETMIALCRSQDIPILLLRESGAGQLPQISRLHRRGLPVSACRPGGGRPAD